MTVAAAATTAVRNAIGATSPGNRALFNALALRKIHSGMMSAQATFSTKA